MWSFVEAWSIGTLSKAIERGGQGALNDGIATSSGRQGLLSRCVLVGPSQSQSSHDRARQTL